MKELSEHEKQLIIDGIPETNLVFFAPGLQGRGGTLIDRSVKAGNGTISGATWKASPRGIRVLYFDGASNQVNCGTNHGVTGNSARTLEAWIYPTEAKIAGILGWGANVSRQLSWLERIASGANWQLYFWGNNADLAGVGAYAINSWYHVAATYNTNKAVVLYVNGAVDTSGTVADTLNTPLSNLLIGVDLSATPRYFHGSIGMVRVYDRVLLAAELLRHYTRERHLFGV